MKRIIISCMIFGLCAIGCGKKPHERYKNDYKAPSADRFVDGSVPEAIVNQKNIKDMTLAEARVARLYYQQHEDLDLLEKALSRIGKISDNFQERSDCLYESANIQLARGRYEAARNQYAQFKELYPGSALRKDALHRELLAHYWACNIPERDQDLTEKTIKLAQSFLEEYPDDVLYAQSIKDTMRLCYQTLLEGEIARMNFYLKKFETTGDEGALRSAQMRLAYIDETLLAQVRTVEDDMLDLVGTIAALKPQKEGEAELDPLQLRPDVRMKVAYALDDLGKQLQARLKGEPLIFAQAGAAARDIF